MRLKMDAFEKPICPVCWQEVEMLPSSGDYYSIKCPRCSEFEITRTAATIFQTSPRLGKKGSRIRANLSAWIRQRKPKESISSYFIDPDHPDEYGREFWNIKLLLSMNAPIGSF
jgi:predicted RNA-binding Zn-ribbon protein involved in translation (DUF1610 family)